MSDDQGSKNGAKGEDLLSKLFDIDDTAGTPSPAKSTQPSLEQVLNDAGDQTEVLHNSAIHTHGHTHGHADNPLPQKSDDALGDNLFDGILNDEDDGTLSDSKINFFSDLQSSKTAPRPDEFLDAKDSTIMLEKSAETSEASDDPLAEATLQEDPIDRALRQNLEPEVEAALLRQSVKPKASPKMDMPSAQRPSAPALSEDEPTPTDEDSVITHPKAQVSAKDFAEVFSSAPIQVPDSSLRQKKSLDPRIFRYSTYFLILAATAAGFVFTFVKLRSDAGVLGYRMDGFKLAQAYRRPDAAAQKEFSLILESAKEARLSDNLEKIESSIASLKSILQKDERNTAAAAAIAEHSAVLTYWQGLTSVWAGRYDEAMQMVNSIQSKLPANAATPEVKLSLERARIWRMISVHDFQKAEVEMASDEAEGAHDDELTLLKAQMLFEENNWTEIPKALQKISSTFVPNNRLRFLQALGKYETDPNATHSELQSLAQTNYLPAQVFALRLSAISKSSAENLLQSSTNLLSSPQMLPSLKIHLLDFRGDIYTVLDDGEKARAEWKALIELSERDSSVLLKLAQSYEDAAMWDDSLEAYRNTLKLGMLKLPDLIKFAQLLRVRGKIVEAMTLLDQGMAAYPKEAILHYEKAKVQLAVYQDDAAKTSFQKALTLNPKLEEASLGLADMALDKKDYGEAEASYQKIGASSPFYSKALRGLGSIAEAKHENVQAEHFYLDALKVNPKLESLYPHLVEIYLDEERDHEAETIVQQGLKLMPKSPLLKVSMAKVYQFQSRQADALQVLEPILEKYEHVLEVQFTAADIYLDQKNFTAAWKVLEPMLNKELRDAELLYLKAKFFYLNPDAQKYGGSTEAANRAVELAVRRDPENERYRILAAQIAIRMQDRSAALDHVEYVLRSRPQSPQAYVMQGDIRLDGAEYDKALRAYQEALKLTRFQAPIFHRLADTYKALGQAPLAIRYYEKVLSERPTDANVHLALGKLYNDESKTSLAVQHLRRTIELSPNEADAYYYLGFILKEGGDKKGAIQNLERFLALDPSSKEAATIKDELYFLKGHTAN